MELNDSNHEKQPRKRRKRKQAEGISISKQTLDTILRQKKRGADMIALLVFYHYTALWQGTNQPRASIRYVAKGLHWGVNKVRRIKSLLVDSSLIEDLCSIDPATKRITGHYIRVSYFHPHCFGEDGKATLTVLPRVAKSNTNASDSDNTNALRSDTTGSTPRATRARNAGNNGAESGLVSEGYQNQNRPARDHIKWPEFAEWCRSKLDRRGDPGTPTEPGFWKWLNGQAPQWRNRVREKFDGEEGCVLGKTFFTRHEANQHGLKHPKLIVKFRKAVRHSDGNIEIISP